MGFKWLKQQLRWEHTEGAKGDYGWSGLDRIVEAANAGGVNVMFSVVAAPAWAVLRENPAFLIRCVAMQR